MESLQTLNVSVRADFIKLLCFCNPLILRPIVSNRSSDSYLNVNVLSEL